MYKILIPIKLKYRYFIKLAFNGTRYHGWQIQKNSTTVQQVLNNALSIILNSEINVTGAGRTDAGVHAKEFYAHFDTDNNIYNKERFNLIYKLNNFLPFDISIYDIIPVKNKAHARFDAISRTYKYYLTKIKNPFYNGLSYFVYGNLNIDLMNEGAKVLYEYKDFSCFSKSHTQVKTNNCKIYYAKWIEKNNKLVFTIKADRFLRNMVRAIVGTLLEIGKEKININDLRQIIKSKNRSNAGYSVPAKGLFLTNIEYPEDIFIL